MAKEQKLDLRLVNDAYQETKKVRKATIPVIIEGRTQEAVLEIDEIFSQSKIRNCVEEFVSRIDAVRKMNENRYQEVMGTFMMFLVIKHFTSFPAPDTYKDQVVIINMLLETQLLHRIFAEFDIKEVEKITEEISAIAGVLEKDVEEFVKIAEQMGLGKEEEEGGVLVEKL